MKILLLQLPVQGHDFFFSNENIPLAPGYLKTVSEEEGFHAELVPVHLMCCGSDQALLQFVLDARPDLVGMSCYLWNVERSLFLARQIKDHLPACTIVMGGPEVTPENGFLLGHRDFDVGVVGEGEETWHDLLRSFPTISHLPGILLPQEEGRWRFTGTNRSSSSLGRWASPFLSGCLDSHLGRVLWLESVRGCAHGCAYCTYHKQSPHVRAFPLERVLEEVRRAWTRGFKEVVFLDPCFSRHPDLAIFLDRLVEINPDRRLHFQAECNAEDIDPWMAEKMGRAGFQRIEIGLQSIKAATLREVHRPFHPQRFLEGVKSLQDSGIEVMVDVIAGLPGDTFADICHTLDWVLGSGAYDSLMLYPLSLIPGTELRQRAGALGLSGQFQPPYLVTRTSEMTAPEMSEAFHYYAERMEEDVCPLEMPAPFASEGKTFELPGGLIHTIDWQRPDQVQRFTELGRRTAYAITVRLSREILKRTPHHTTALRQYLRENPFSLVSIEVPADSFPDELKPLWELSGDRNLLLDRDFTVTHTPYRSLFIFSRAQGLFWKWPDPRESLPLTLLDGQEVPCHPVCLVASPEEEIPRRFFEHMAKRYSPLPEIKRWEKPDDKPG